MIPVIENLMDLDKHIRNELIEQSGLLAKRVLNAISVRGQDLSKLIDDNIYMSYNLSDCVIIFEVLIDSDSSDNVSLTEKDESITDYSAFNVKVIVYGNKSNILCHKIKSRFLSEEVRQSLWDNGIHLIEISNIESINEFINNTIWTRCDFDIKIACRLNFDKTISNKNFEELNDIDIIKI